MENSVSSSSRHKFNGKHFVAFQYPTNQMNFASGKLIIYLIICWIYSFLHFFFGMQTEEKNNYSDRCFRRPEWCIHRCTNYVCCLFNHGIESFRPNSLIKLIENFNSKYWIKVQLHKFFGIHLRSYLPNHYCLHFNNEFVSQIKAEKTISIHWTKCWREKKK